MHNKKGDISKFHMYLKGYNIMKLLHDFITQNPGFLTCLDQLTMLDFLTTNIAYPLPPTPGGAQILHSVMLYSLATLFGLAIPMMKCPMQHKCRARLGDFLENFVDFLILMKGLVLIPITKCQDMSTMKSPSDIACWYLSNYANCTSNFSILSLSLSFFQK